MTSKMGIFSKSKWIYLIFLLISIIKTKTGIASNTHTPSKYARMRAFLPEVSQQESRYWQMARGASQPHPCRRTCFANETMTCYYYLVVHYDETMGATCQRYLQAKHRFKVSGKEYIDAFSLRNDEFVGYDDCKYADGVFSELMLINGMLPGPAIEVCQGDTVVADVINSLHDPTTIHWHGMHQRQTPHMDGVPHVTQYPIEPGQAYRYRFPADRVGTNYWHSHVMHQRAFGLAGALIIRQPRAENPQINFYDFDLAEHVLLLQDWVHNFDENVPQNLLINGHGRNVGNKAKMPTLYASFSVNRGARYRFRVIFNGITNCPISFSIDKHDLLVIATDGHDIQPITVQKLTIQAGERYDFVLHAKQPTNNYWIRVKGYKFCANAKLHQEAVLHYSGMTWQSLPKSLPFYEYEPKGLDLNALDKGNSISGQHLTVLELDSLTTNSIRPTQPQRTYYIGVDIVERNGAYLFQVDDITFTPPKLSLLQARNLGIGQLFCNKSQQAARGRNCRTGDCRCLHVLQIPSAQHVEIVFASKGGISHPMHLHGYSFRVVGMGILGETRINQIEQIDRQAPLPRRLNNAPLKDTVQVPAFGYTIVRFYSDNPGYWLLHCHHSTHSENGMAAVVRVGEDAQMSLCPVSNCALCSSMQ